MKKLVIFTLYGEEGASSNYRIRIFRNELESKYNVKWFNFWPKNYLKKYAYNKKKFVIPIIFLYIASFIKRFFQILFTCKKANIVFVQKGMFPGLNLNLIDYIKRHNARVVFDVDDAIYCNKNDFSDNIAKKVDAIICGNRTLIDHYQIFNNNCYLIPTTDDTRKYSNFWHESFGNKIIGWIGSSATIDNLRIVKNPLKKILTKYPGVRFIYLSDSSVDMFNGIDGVEFVKWASDTYLEEISNFTVGIMPLFDTPVNRGKCGFKLVQYLSMKKPVIGSPVGVNEEIIGNCGICPKTESDWFTALERILFSREMYDGLVEEINTSFFDVYGFNVVINKIINVLEGDQ